MTSFDGDRAAAAMAAALAAGDPIVFQSCAHCHKPPAPGSKLRNCKGCLVVCYCSVDRGLHSSTSQLNLSHL